MSCGRVLGHGLSCEPDYLCDQCRRIAELEDRYQKQQLELSGAYNETQRLTDHIAELEARLAAVENLIKEYEEEIAIGNGAQQVLEQVVNELHKALEQKE